MPEQPDVEVYLGALERHVGGREVEIVRLGSPFLLRTVEPKIDTMVGRVPASFHRIGKRLVLGFDPVGGPASPDDPWVDRVVAVVHLMVAGRLRLRRRGQALNRKTGLLALDFAHGTLVLTEAGTSKRASLHMLRTADRADAEAKLAPFDKGGLELVAGTRAWSDPKPATLPAFRERLTSRRHTLKRALTDPHLLSGIGGAYADEVLHLAKLSPVSMTTSLGDDAMERLHAACVEVLTRWTATLEDRLGAKFPDKVTAFVDGMAVHGRFGEPCPVCEAPVQRIVYATRETNYCATCQTGGRVLADRALSRLLKSDWPRSLEELDKLRPTH